MKVALVHDWLTGLRGGEKCLQAFVRMFPEADIFTLLHVPGTTDPIIDSKVVQTSFLQRLPNAPKIYRAMLPVYPLAVRGLDLSGYDLVVSLSHAAVKNVRVPTGVPHFCYCFTPMRYIWDQVQAYLGAGAYAAWPLVAALRRWDVAGSTGVTQFVAISDFVAARIRRFYGRRASVIYPPVDTSWITPAEPGERGDAFLYAGALVPYKQPDLVVDTFTQLGEPLVVVGTGPEKRKLEARAGKNVYFAGHATQAELAQFYRGARALIYPGVEDFGMVPVECMAAGRPVIAQSKGGLGETVIGLNYWDKQALAVNEATGVFLPRGHRRNEKAMLSEAVQYFCAHEQEFDPFVCRQRAEQFSPFRFFNGWDVLLKSHGLPGIDVERLAGGAGDLRVANA